MFESRRAHFAMRRCVNRVVEPNGLWQIVRTVPLVRGGAVPGSRQLRQRTPWTATRRRPFVLSANSPNASQTLDAVARTFGWRAALTSHRGSPHLRRAVAEYGSVSDSRIEWRYPYSRPRPSPGACSRTAQNGLPAAARLAPVEASRPRPLVLRVCCEIPEPRRIAPSHRLDTARAPQRPWIPPNPELRSPPAL